MILYKDREYTRPALCPMCFCQPLGTGADYYCTTECAWCVHMDPEFICGILDSYAGRKLPMYAEALKDGAE